MECSTTLVVAQLGDLSCILGLDFLPEYEAKMDMNAGRIHSPFFGEIGLIGQRGQVTEYMYTHPHD